MRVGSRKILKRLQTWDACRRVTGFLNCISSRVFLVGKKKGGGEVYG